VGIARAIASAKSAPNLSNFILVDARARISEKTTRRASQN
jgi:hypothetical protein